MNAIVTLLLPPALTFILAMALHLFAKERAVRAGVLPAALTVLLCWAFVVRPGWMPVDDIRRIVHIAVGAALLGLALDALRPPRLAVALLVAFFVLGSALASVTGVVVPRLPATWSEGLVTGAAAATGFLVLARFDSMRERPLSLVLLLTVVACGLTVISAIVRDATLTGLGGVLATALAGYLIFVVIARAAVTDGLILFAGSSMLAMIWALAQHHPGIRLALLCVPLVLFAEATAMRVPLPAARVSAVLYPLILASLVSLPLALAGLIAFVTTIP